MKLQYLCHSARVFSAVLLALAGTAARPAHGDVPAHDYPTLARVEYVNECIGKHGGKLAALYQCSCAIDRIADTMAYDDFVEASTFSKYATLPGEGGGIFRDSDHARQVTKNFRELEIDALRSCGMPH
jgi:hypothetical protein